jgi:hypothetical protein
MTIRQVLVRRYGSFLLSLVLVLALGRVWHPTAETHALRNGVLLILGLSLLIFLGLGFRCPRCHTMLTIRSASILSGRPVGCPKCGLNLDEAMDRSAK